MWDSNQTVCHCLSDSVVNKNLSDIAYSTSAIPGGTERGLTATTRFRTFMVVFIGGISAGLLVRALWKQDGKVGPLGQWLRRLLTGRW